MNLNRNRFSGFEEDVDNLFMRYFRAQDNSPTLFIQNNPVKSYFFNEYVSLRQESQFPEYPAVVVTPSVSKESTDYPFYSAPFIRKGLASDGTLTFYKFESLIWKDFTYQVDAISKDYIIQKRLHVLLSNKLFPRLNGARFFKVNDYEYRPLTITDVQGWTPEPDGTFKSTVTYLLKIPVWETEPIIQGSYVQINLDLTISGLSLEIADLNLEDSYRIFLKQSLEEISNNRESLSIDELNKSLSQIKRDILFYKK